MTNKAQLCFFVMLKYIRLLEIYNNIKIILCFFDNNINQLLFPVTFFKRHFVLCYKVALSHSL